MSVTFKLDKATAQALDREAERLTEEMGFPVARASVIRSWLKESAARRRGGGK